MGRLGLHSKRQYQPNDLIQTPVHSIIMYSDLLELIEDDGPSPDRGCNILRSRQTCERLKILLVCTSDALMHIESL